MNGNGSCPSVAWVKFNKIIKIRGFIGTGGKKRKVMSAKYKGENCSEPVLLIPKGGNVSANGIYIAFLPVNSYPSGYCDDKSIFFVRTIKPRIVNGIIILRDTIMPRDIFEIESPKNNGIILIRDPSEKFKTFLFLIKMECRDNKEAVIRFIGKNLIDKEIKMSEDGLIEVTVGTSENSEYLLEGFLNNLTEYIRYSSEA